MSKTSFFGVEEPIRYEGPQTERSLAFRHYDPERIVLGKTMREQLRMAVCYWHNFVWTGTDPFGAPSFERPWLNETEPVRAARLKAERAFEMFRLLGFPFFCFHDADAIQLGETIAENERRMAEAEAILAGKMEETGVRLLWGTANLFSHRRYLAGALTNPDPAIFAHAVAQVKICLETTRRLGGENYVLWGGREGYDTLLNTDLKREAECMARFLEMVVEHKHRIGFKGTILIEPKPQEPAKHQYDRDAATACGFLARHGLEKEVKLNVEVNHATLAGHSFEHEVAVALSLDALGSIDVNRETNSADGTPINSPTNPPNFCPPSTKSSKTADWVREESTSTPNFVASPSIPTICCTPTWEEPMSARVPCLPPKA